MHVVDVLIEHKAPLGFLCRRRWPVAAALTAIAALLAACGTVPSAEQRSEQISNWAMDQDWQPWLLPGDRFDLMAFVPRDLGRVERLTVYIEGDGLAWLDRYTPALAPTPSDPVALRLAMTDAGAQAVYLARPCQYTSGPSFKGCNSRYWGSHRFAPEVVDAMNRAVDDLLRAHGASRLVLVGYSGGAAVAALLAERRQDVDALVTVAGVLDADGWTRQQRVSPLHGSLDPLLVSAPLADLPQWHFVGGQDRTVPGGLLARFLATASGQKSKAVVHVEPSFDHGCCWPQAWPVLSRAFAACAAAP